MKIRYQFVLVILVGMALIYCNRKKNNAPDAPSVPAGPNTGTQDTSYDFSSSVVDPDGDDIAIRFSWGDDSLSDWSAFTPGGSITILSHSYTSIGTYSIQAQAKDDKDTSAWSDPHQISIHDFPYRVVQTVTVGTNPYGVAVLPGGEYVYVTNNNTDNVSVIRTSDNTVVDTIQVGSVPYGVAVLPNGNFVYVANNEDNNVSVIGY